MKTDPRPYAFVFVGLTTMTVDASFNGLKVKAITGGTVTRGGTALVVNDTLATNDVLIVTPTVLKGTVTLNCEKANQEFSGLFADLSGLSVDTTTNPPKLKYTRSDNVKFELALTPTPVVTATYALGNGWYFSGAVNNGDLWGYSQNLPSLDPHANVIPISGQIDGLPQVAQWSTVAGFEGITTLPVYKFTGNTASDPNRIDLYLVVPTDATPPASGLTLTFVFQP